MPVFYRVSAERAVDVLKRKNSSLKFVTERTKERKRVTAFIGALVGFIVVFGAASGFVLLKSNDYSFSKILGSPEAETQVNREPEEVAPEMPDLEGSTNILFIGTGGDAIEYGAVFHCDLEQVKITVCPFDTAISVAVDGRSDTLSGHYAYAGMSQVVKAVEQSLGITVDRYVCVTKSGMSDLVKVLGGIPMTFDQALSYKGEDFSLTLKAGEQTVSGESFYKYLIYPASGKAQQLENQGKAFCAFTDALLTLDNLLDGEKFFSSVINCTESDISIEDYTKSERVLEYFVKSEDRQPNEATTDASRIR